MISLDKKYRTRSGLDVRIYAVDGMGHYPVHGAHGGPEGWISGDWMEYGSYDSDVPNGPLDLIEVRSAEDVVAELFNRVADLGKYPNMPSATCQALRESGHLKDET